MVRIAVRLAGIVMLLFFAYMLCHIQNQLIELKNNPKPRPTAAGRAAG